MKKQHWLIRVSQGHASYAAATPVAHLAAETESENLPRPDAQKVFKAIDSLKIITNPPASFIVDPLDGLPEQTLASVPDWLGDNLKVWLLRGDSGHGD